MHEGLAVPLFTTEAGIRTKIACDPGNASSFGHINLPPEQQQIRRKDMPAHGPGSLTEK